MGGSIEGLRMGLCCSHPRRKGSKGKERDEGEGRGRGEMGSYLGQQQHTAKSGVNGLGRFCCSRQRSLGSIWQPHRSLPYSETPQIALCR